MRLLPILLLTALAAADGPSLRPLHLKDGLPRNPEKSRIHRIARDAGVDLEAPDHPIVAHRYADGRLFYVFYKTVEGALGERPYLVQRIRKTERTWKTKDAEPTVRVTYQVEVFKTIAGALKRADQHFGSFGLRDNHRRDVLKEYEIGFGEVGEAKGKAWPFDPGTLFRNLQPYQEDAGIHQDVVFTKSTTWSLLVAFGKDGTYTIRSPELKIDAPRSLPEEKDTRPRPVPDSEHLVLLEGKGVGGFALRTGTPGDLAREIGPPVAVAKVGKGHENHALAVGLTVNFDEHGKANTVITQAGFAGRTGRGIRLWDTRGQVMDAYGPPARQGADAPAWRYKGILFLFDGFDRVKRVVLLR